MLSDFAAIIDALYTRKRSGRRGPKQIVFIVGNGILPVSNILNDADLKAKAKAKHLRSPAAWEAFKWRHFEFARYWTSSALPSFAHCCIYKLVQDGLCKDVMTTNYDLYFDTIWDRAPHLSVSRNPVAAAYDFLWDDYYSTKPHPNAPRYWKIHGSLSHVCFRPRSGFGQPHIHRLPRFAISSNNDKLASSYGIPTQAPFMGYETTMFPRAPFTPLPDLQGNFSPFIDWTYNNDRSNFRREIAGAQAVLRRPKSLAAVFLLGFTGYYNDADPCDPWNEELVPELRQLRASGFSNLFMAVHDKQYAARLTPTRSLMRELDAIGRCATYSDAGALMNDLCRNHSTRYPIRITDYIYKRWIQNYQDDIEPTHI